MTANPSASFLHRDVGHNSALSPRSPQQRSFTSPQKSYTMSEFSQHPSRYTAPVGSNRTNFDFPQKSYSDMFSYHSGTGPSHQTMEGGSEIIHSHQHQHEVNTSARNHSLSSGSLYPPSLSEQPGSFPQVSPHQPREFSSLKDSSASKMLTESSVDSVPQQYHYTQKPTVPYSDSQHHQQQSSSSSLLQSQRVHSAGYSDSAFEISDSRPSKISASHHDALHMQHREKAVSTNARSFSDNTLTVPAYNPTPRQSVQPAVSHLSTAQAYGTTKLYSRTSAPSFSLAQTSGPAQSAYDETSYHTPPRTPSRRVCSQATLENERYSLDKFPCSDHPNEDRHFALEGPNYNIFGVFDGHDGPRAAGFASNYMMHLFDTPSWHHIVWNASPSIIIEALTEFFRVTESDFFKSIQRFIDRKEAIQKRIPPDLSSYQALQQYPYEVSQLQEIEPKLTGGCTAVLAAIVNDMLYIANVGDSRAVLAYEQPNGTLAVEQLSVDHSVENENELKRLEALGLDPKELIKAGRLGMQENTRSIGDYSIKQGYKDVDTLRIASSAPGIVTPYIMPTRTIDHTYKYLILMTDGVYKSLESTFDQQQSIDPNKVVLAMLEQSLRVHKGDFMCLADNVLGRLCKIHSDCYEKHARQDLRSPLAVSCRKRDDMTLLVYKFPDLKSQ